MEIFLRLVRRGFQDFLQAFEEKIAICGALSQGLSILPFDGLYLEPRLSAP